MIHYWIFKYLNYQQKLKYKEKKERISFDIFKSTFDIAKNNITIKEFKYGLKVYLAYYDIPRPTKEPYFYFSSSDCYYVDFSFIDYIKFVLFIRYRMRKKKTAEKKISYVTEPHILPFLQKRCDEEIKKYEEEVNKARKDIEKIMERI